MLKTILALVLVIVSMIGIVDAGYISYEKFSGRLPPCNAIFKCGEVLNSPYAAIGPIPLSALGLVFYTIFFILSGYHVLIMDQLDHPHVKKVRISLSLLGIFGFGFSLYLVFLMGVVLQAWCFYCLLSALNCVVLFLGSSALFIISRRRSSDAVQL